MTKYLLLFLFFLVFHYRIYYFLEIGGSVYVALFLAIIAFVLIWFWMADFDHSLPGFFVCLFSTFLFLFASHFLGNKILENFLLYKKAEQRFGMVYSCKLKRCWTPRGTIQCDVHLINDIDTSKNIYVEKCYELPQNYNLISYPKLAHDDEFGYYSIYHKRLFENNPTDIQLEYCKDGARLSEKINSLKKYSGVVLENELLDYMVHINQHDNRIISAVVERRGEKYLFANVLQSDDKLWAFKYRDVEEGKKVLIIYDISSPHLFFVIDWNPSDEDYEYYNTKEGKNPTFKYLLKLERLSSSLQAKNDEERVED